ncbi:hypothetical protein PCANB_000904 [Pneumocystis canis]|nr:hypothetical protein PCANB_000904 [Pneumocystis canis]
MLVDKESLVLYLGMSIFYVGIARGQVILSEYSVNGMDMNHLVSLILERVGLNEETRLTYVYKTYMIHYIYSVMPSMDGLTYLCITSDQIERRIPFVLLHEIKREFSKNFSLSDICELPVTSFSDFSQRIAEKVDMMNREDEMMITDITRVVQKEMENVKAAMVENIERVLERGERIELLVDRTQNMNEMAFSFSKRSSHLRRRIWWESMKIIVIFFFVILFLLYLLIGFGCGFPSWQSCR